MIWPSRAGSFNMGIDVYHMWFIQGQKMIYVKVLYMSHMVKPVA